MIRPIFGAVVVPQVPHNNLVYYILTTLATVIYGQASHRNVVSNLFMEVTNFFLNFKTTFLFFFAQPKITQLNTEDITVASNDQNQLWRKCLHACIFIFLKILRKKCFAQSPL